MEARSDASLPKSLACIRRVMQSDISKSHMQRKYTPDKNQEGSEEFQLFFVTVTGVLSSNLKRSVYKCITE